MNILLRGATDQRGSMPTISGFRNRSYGLVGFAVLTAVTTLSCNAVYTGESTDVWKEHTASIFRVDEKDKHVSIKAFLIAQFLLPTCSACSSTPKMEAVCSSETSVDFHPIIRLYVPEDNIFKIILFVRA
jgi:hypothetical protein